MMLEALVVILVLLWALGYFAAPLIFGSLIHLLLVIALVVIVIRLIQGRPPIG